MMTESLSSSGDHAMILPFRLNLNEGVLAASDFAFCFSQAALWCNVWVVWGHR